MAITITKVPGTLDVGPATRKAVFDITLDSSYPTGGEAVQGADFGFRTVLGMEFIGGNAAAALYHPHFDTANLKIMMARSAGFTPAGTNSKPTFTVTKGAILASSELGLSADAATATVNNNTIAATQTLTTNSPVSIPTFTGTAVAAAAFAEVAAGVSLATVTLRAIVHGV